MFDIKLERFENLNLNRAYLNKDYHFYTQEDRKLLKIANFRLKMGKLRSNIPFNGKEHRVNYNNLIKYRGFVLIEDEVINGRCVAKLIRFDPDIHTLKVKIKPSYWEKVRENKFYISNVGDVTLGSSVEKSQATAWLRVWKIKVPVISLKYVHAGDNYEPYILSEMQKHLGSDVKIETFKDKFNIFDDDRVGGVPDGIVKNDKLLIEVKTASVNKIAHWLKHGIPAKYIQQATKYASMLGYDKAVIAYSFLTEFDYYRPKESITKEKDVKVHFWYFDVEPKKVKRLDRQINSFINTYIPTIDQIKNDSKVVSETYTSPPIKFSKNKWSKDKSLFEWLSCENENDYRKWYDQQIKVLSNSHYNSKRSKVVSDEEI